MRVRNIAAGALAIAALTGQAAAQQSVDVRRAAAATGPLEVHVMSGEIRMVGWNRDEVHVTGELGRGAERIDVSSQGDRVVVRVHQSRHTRGGSGSNLQIRYPARRTVNVTTTSADVQSSGAAGAIQAHTVSGNVDVDGRPSSVEVNSRSGDVRLRGSTQRLTVNSISGDVQVEAGVSGAVDVHTVSGDISLRGGAGNLRVQSVSGSIEADRVARAGAVQTVSGDIQISGESLSGEYNTVSGDITLTGAPAAGRTLEVHSHSGTVLLRLPRRASADVEINTWSGEIGIDMPGANLMASSRRERQVRLGRGGPRIEVSTFSGTVRLVEQ